MERYWSAGGGKGWPMSAVLDALERDWGWPDARSAQTWDLRGFLMVERGKPDPVVVTASPVVHDVARLCGRDVAFIPTMLGEPIAPPDGYVEQYSSGCGDPWLRWPS
jgi:hypothetical protein